MLFYIRGCVLAVSLPLEARVESISARAIVIIGTEYMVHKHKHNHGGVVPGIQEQLSRQVT